MPHKLLGAFVRRAVVLVGCSMLLLGILLNNSLTAHAAPQTSNHASLPLGGSLKSIVCGGTKFGSGWQTFPTGGYVGEGCGAGIDFISTPTKSTSWYDFGIADGNTYHFQVWIPTTHATAHMDYTMFICGGAFLDRDYHQDQLNGWQDYVTVAPGAGCDVQFEAWSGTTSSAFMGLDAIRSHN